MPESPKTDRQLLSIVVPVLDEQDSLAPLHERLTAVAAGLDGLDTEFIYVNDGSRDDSLACLHALQAEDARISVLDLSRNFGKEAAMTAGLDHCRGDAVVLIDADMQDPPELIPQLIEQWRAGHDVVYALRESRSGETRLKRLTAWLFYRLMGRVGEVAIPADAGDFRLLSRQAVDALSQLRERHRFNKGLFTWIGYPQTAVTYQREGRGSGRSKWSYWRLWNYALEGITSHSTLPLRFAMYLGFIVAGFAFLRALFLIWEKLVLGNPVAGYPSLMVSILFLGGVQLITLGIIGEYLGRTYGETKARPLYLIREYRPGETASEMAGEMAREAD